VPEKTTRKRPYYRTPKINRPDITVGGVTWTPRARFADELKLAENTIRSWNLQTVYPGGIAHVRREEGLRRAVRQRSSARASPPR
jgi:hypothetical protein